MGSSSEKTVTQADAQPWEAAQPLLKKGIGEAEDLFDVGGMFQPNTTSQVVPWSDNTQAGMSDIQNRAAQGMAGGTGMDKAYDFYSGIFDGNRGNHGPGSGLAPSPARGNHGPGSGLATSPPPGWEDSSALPAASGVSGLSAAQRGVADQYRTTASGSELNNTSPAFDNVLNRMQGDVRNQVGMAASARGRYGAPGAHQGVLAREVGDMTNNALTGEYGRQLGRMDTARGNLASLGQQGIQNQFGAASAMPGAWEARGEPARQLMSLGQMDEDLYARQIGDANRIFDETAAAPRSAVEWINSIGSGAGSLGRNTAQTQVAPGTNPFVKALGYGLGLSGLGGR